MIKLCGQIVEQFECSAVDADNYINENILILKEKVSIGTPLNARYVKIVPTEWENHISMRFGLLLKEYSKGDKKYTI